VKHGFDRRPAKVEYALEVVPHERAVSGGADRAER
jgi:hypothetical protein